jgi:hypothetical protein
MSDYSTHYGETDYFTDSDELDALLDDRRSLDQRVVSSKEDAEAVVEDFRWRDITSPWASLNRWAVADRLLEIIAEPRAIQQGALNLCGPASFICMWNSRDPVGFVNYATELFDTGTGYIGSLEITPTSELLEMDFNTISDQANTQSADWMVLGAIRNSPDLWWQPTWSGDPSQELAGLTRPEELAEWLEATGIYQTVSNEANWMEEKGAPHALSLTQQEGRDIALLININLINYAEGSDLDTGFLSMFPNHFVVLLSDVMTNPQNTHVMFSLWSWGRSKIMLNVPIQAFVENYYGAVIATMP